MNPDRDLDLERLEAYLRQFEARAPRPLPVRQPRRVRPPVVLMALAATLLIAISLLLVWQRRMKVPAPQQFTQRETPAADEISFAQLSRIARQEPEKLDSHLDRLSAKLLPDPGGSEGVLNRLSRE